MRDLREDLDPIWRSAMRLGGASDGARIMMFTSALGGEGVSSMAASFACLAARRSEKPVWLVELDFRGNPQFTAFKKGFARVMDGIALVVAADHTTPSEVDDARSELEARQGRVLGAVLNRVKADARFADRFSA